MRVLTVNPGSSSVKLAVIEDGTELASTTIDQASADRARGALTELLAAWAPVDMAGVRFVHGGDRSEPVLLDDKEITRLTGLVALAPLHQPLSLEMTDMVRGTLPVPVVACFDTAFHAHIPESAARYALPRAWVTKYGLRRYGFHGLSCAYALRRTAEFLAKDTEDLRMICAHVGAGVSVTAIRGGHSVDTSMGFTPLEGAVMATRSGSVDPGLLLYLLRNDITDVAELERVLDKESGLAGMTGTSGDMRDVLAAGHTDAIAVYVHRLRREIGAMAASLDRLDALVLTGGVAEHQPGLVADIAGGLGIFDVAVDPDRMGGEGDRVVSTDGVDVRVLVLTAREDLEIADQATTWAIRNGETT